jgi:putative oxidoreductase
MKLGRLFLRGSVGSILITHGAQKLFGWFGGRGIEATAQGFESMGLRPGRRNVIAASGTEIGTGTLMALGLATPLAAAGVTAVMTTAIHRVHGKNGFFNASGGYEYNLLLAAGALALADAGPGDPSLDSALGINMHGPKWAIAALATGLAGAAGAHALAARQQPAPEAAQPTAQAQQPDTPQPAMAT